MFFSWMSIQTFSQTGLHFAAFFLRRGSTVNWSAQCQNGELYLRITVSGLLTKLCAGCHHLCSPAKLISQRAEKWTPWLLLFSFCNSIFFGLLSLLTYIRIACKERFVWLKEKIKKQDLLFSFQFAWEALLSGDTVCTEQSVLMKQQKANQPSYLRVCHRCINCLHNTFFPLFPLSFGTIYPLETSAKSSQKRVCDVLSCSPQPWAEHRRCVTHFHVQ